MNDCLQSWAPMCVGEVRSTYQHTRTSTLGICLANSSSVSFGGEASILSMPAGTAGRGSGIALRRGTVVAKGQMLFLSYHIPRENRTSEAPLGGERLSSDFSPPSLVHPKSVDPCRLQVPERSSQHEGALFAVAVRGWFGHACEMHGRERPTLV